MRKKKTADTNTHIQYTATVRPFHESNGFAVETIGYDLLQLKGMGTVKRERARILITTTRDNTINRVFFLFIKEPYLTLNFHLSVMQSQNNCV